MKRLIAVALVACIAANDLWAQEAGPRTDALLTRAERGDLQARKDVESLAWLWIKRLAADGHLDPVSSRAMAHTLLILQEPLPAPDIPPALEQRPFRGAFVSALQMGLAGDSGDVWSATQFERLAPYPYIWMDPDEQLLVLRSLARHANAVPEPLRLTRIRLELERGSPDSAAIAFAALPTAGGSQAARGHLAAEIAFAQRYDSAGAIAYYAGAAAIRDSADAAWYTRDLLWIAKVDELDEWNALAPNDREAWLEMFWNGRDIQDGQLPGMRLPEQFRRWRVALREFRWVYDASTARGLIIPRDDGAEYNKVDDLPFPHDPNMSELVYLNRMRPLSQVLDDRGGLILRHGDPARRLTLPGVEFMSEETIMWNTPTGPLIVSFSRSMSKALYSTVSQRYGMNARNFPEGDLMANCELDSRLCLLAVDVQNAQSPGGRPLGPLTFARANSVLKDFTQMRETAEHTDGNAETFKNDLGAIVEAYGIPDRGTLVVYALPVKGLVPDDKQRDSTRSLAARLRIVAGDVRRGEFAAALDTVRNWRLDTAPNDSTHLTGFLLLPTPVGEWSVSVVLSDLARTAGTGQQIFGVPVSGFNGKTLQLSDLILGSPESSLSWTYDGTKIPLNPRNAWRANEAAVLTYQVDGLVRSHVYDTHIEIWDADRKAKAFKNAISFSASATDARTMIQRDISLRELGIGDYRVVVRLRDTTTGSEVVRERLLAVRK